MSEFMGTQFYWFFLGVLSVWRVTHLLNAGDGPWELVVWLRRCAGTGFWAALLDCFYCLSLWIAAPAALFLSRKPVEGIFTWLALSGGACLLERTLNKSVVIEPMPPEAEREANDVLRTETLTNAEQPATEEDVQHASVRIR